MEEIKDKIAIIININDKIDVVNLRYYNESVWDSFNTMRDKSDKIISFSSRREAIDYIMDTFNDGLIDPIVIAESCLPENISFSGGTEMLFR